MVPSTVYKNRMGFVGEAPRLPENHVNVKQVPLITQIRLVKVKKRMILTKIGPEMSKIPSPMVAKQRFFRVQGPQPCSVAPITPQSVPPE
jgi:hypothetical protein